MESKELMLDDLVLYEGMPARVTKLVPKVRTDGTSSSIEIKYLQGDKFACWDKFVKPIPLTKEMMQANGFVYKPNSDEKDDGWWCWRRLGVQSGNEYVNIAFRNDDIAIYDLGIMKGNNDGNFHLNYVHELQHLLKVMQIELDINLV